MTIRYELADGQIRSEEAAYKDGFDEHGNPAKILVLQGAMSFTGPGEIDAFAFVINSNFVHSHNRR